MRKGLSIKHFNMKQVFPIQLKIEGKLKMENFLIFHGRPFANDSYLYVGVEGWKMMTI